MASLREITRCVLCAGVFVAMAGSSLLAWGLSDIPDANVPEANGTVWAIVQSEARVYVGGDFTQLGGVARNRLAAFDATSGVVDVAWNPNMDGSVRSLVVSDGKVYAGGDFTTVNGATTRNSLAAFNLADGSDNGTTDAAWNPNIDIHVYALAVSEDRVYAGGGFAAVNGGTTRNGLAAFNKADGVDTGTADAAWNPDVNYSVFDIAVSGDRVYAAGAFTMVNGGTIRVGLAAFTLADGVNTGTVDAAWNPNLNNSADALAISGSKVYAGGGFTTVNGGTTRNRLAAFNLADGVDTGTADAAWNPDVASQDVDALVVLGGKVYAGGGFTTVNGGMTRNRFAAFNLADGADTGTADPWNPNSETNVCVLASSGTGLFAGGYFSLIGGNSHNHLVGFGSTVPVTLSAFSVE